MAENAAADAGVWDVLLTGRRYLKTSDVQTVCDRFRDLRGGGAALSDSWLTVQELTSVLGSPSDGDGVNSVQPLFDLLRASELERGTGAHDRVDLRVLLVAMAGLTKAKVPDRMRFSAFAR
jgi:hypothetical protein